MSNFQRMSKKLPQQLINEKLANDLKLNDKFQKRFSTREENENDYEIEIKGPSSSENLSDQSYEYNESSKRQQIPQYKQQQQLDRISPLSKTPDSIDDWTTNSSANSSTINTAPYRTHYHSNNSSISPSNESLKRGAGISSGIGTQSDNEMLGDECSTDDIGEDIEIIEEDLPDEEVDDDDDDHEYYGDFEDHEEAKIRNLQIEAEKLKNSKVVKQSPLPPLPKLNDIQKHLNDFFNQIITNEKPYNAKLAYLIGFRNELQNHCTDASSADISVLFTHIEQIFEQHNLFINELKKILNDLLRNDLLNLLLNALNVFSVMLSTSLKLYCEFLDNYPRAMVILNKFENEKYKMNQLLTNNLKQTHSQPSQLHRQQKQQQPSKRKSFIECEYEFFQNIYTNNELCDTAQIFSNDLLNHPLLLVRHWLSLKDECIYFIRFSKNNEYKNETELNQRIKKLFYDNQEYNSLKNEIFCKVDRVLLPNRIRKNEDVVELCENGEKKLRHLILFGDCLICCRFKKDKKQLKWFIPMDRLEIHLVDSKDSKKSADNDLKNLRDEVATLSGDLRRHNESDTMNRSTVKLRRKLDEHTAELQLKLSTFKLLIRYNPNSYIGAASSGLANSMLNLSGTNSQLNTSTSSIVGSGLSSKNETFQFLFTSDFERTSWLEEINGAIYAYKSRKTSNSLTAADIEGRINNLQKNADNPKKSTFVTCTGTLELTIRNLEGLSQANKVFVAVELKSFGSYIQVLETKCTEYTTKPQWDQTFDLELQCVDSIRIILYAASSKPLAIGSHELKIDPKHFDAAKTVSIKLNNNLCLTLNMKFKNPKKTITRRKTKNKNDLFGNHINDVLQKEKSTIPRILIDCVEVIESKGIEEIGIFRVSAVVSEVHRMKELYSKNPKAAQLELRQKSPHLAASLLKLYLRELPEPLFTTHLYPQFINSIEIFDNPQLRDQTLCETFNQLPDSNKTILIFILNHLHNIANNSQKNKMDCRNLTTLFGPTLMKLSPKDKTEADNMAREISESTQQASVLFYIMKLHSQEKLIQYNKQQSNLESSEQKTTNSTISSQDVNNRPVHSRSFFPLFSATNSQPTQTPSKVQHNKQTAL